MEVEKKILFPTTIHEETGLGYNTIYKLLKSGAIKSTKAGDRYLVSRANFEKWLNGESNQAVVKTC